MKTIDHDTLIAFAKHITGHDKETVEQLFDDFVNLPISEHLKVKSYTIIIRETGKNTHTLSRQIKGFNKLELLGLMQLSQVEIIEDIKKSEI